MEYYTASEDERTTATHNTNPSLSPKAEKKEQVSEDQLPIRQILF